MHFFSQKIIKLFVFVVILFSPVLVFAVSQAACIFLLIEQGSRSGGMGQAYVAQVDDAYAGWWNPGAMAFNRKNQLALMHSNWFGDVAGIDDMYIEYLAWNNYFESMQGNLGFHIIYLTYGEQDLMDEQGEWLGTFTSFEVATAATYAYQYSDNLGLGITFKIIYSDLAPDGGPSSTQTTKGRGISFAFDLGLLKKNLLLRGLDLGLNLQNIGPDITYIDKDQADPLPMNFRLGLSYRLLESDLNKFTINGEMSKELATQSDPLHQRLLTGWSEGGADGPFLKRVIDSTIFSVGAEYTYWNFLSMRGGYFYDKAGHIQGLAFGAGIQYTFTNKYKAKFDFAFQPAGELTDYNKTFSLGIDF